MFSFITNTGPGNDKQGTGLETFLGKFLFTFFLLLLTHIIVPIPGLFAFFYTKDGCNVTKYRSETFRAVDNLFFTLFSSCFFLLIDFTVILLYGRASTIIYKCYCLC